MLQSNWRWISWRTACLALFLAILCLSVPYVGHAQVTATLTGTVQDSTGGVIPNAKVTLTNEDTKEGRTETTNGAGLYAFPSLVPGIYDIKASAKGFEAKVVTGIVLNAGDSKTVPSLSLTVGAETLTVTVSATEEMIPVENGAHTDVLTSKDIDTLALEGRDASELLRVLPGTVTASGGLNQTAPMFSDLTVTVDEGAEGDGMWTNGSIYRGGTSILVDGAETIDIGNMAQSLVVVPPEMTSQVSVQSSNMSADQPFGPIVISTLSKYGGANFHGEGYFDARNNVLNANGWQQKAGGQALGAQHYYYPGGNAGGPVPGTHKHLMFWGGYEKWLQNLGNGSIATSYIPTPEMLAGDFSTDNADNKDICPNGFYVGAAPNGLGKGAWCSDLGGTILANGTTTKQLPQLAASGTDAGQSFPAGFIDPGTKAMASLWPKATSSTPLSVCGGCNYYFPVPNQPNGWIYRFRIDYQLGDNTKIYGSMEQAYAINLAGNVGSHLYWTPGNSVPYPGGAEIESDKGKVLAGHIVHNFSSTTTNDLMAAWAFGSYPFVTPDPSAAYKTTVGYTYGKVFTTPSLNIPAYNSNGYTPDFSQASIFENPPGQYGVKKEAPQFADTLTKVWGTHTIKIGGFTQTTDNWQSSFGYYLDGNLSFNAGQNPDTYEVPVPGGEGKMVPSVTEEGSPNNPVAQWVSGIASSYSENSAAPIGDVAELNTAGFIDDTFKASKKLTLELGLRVEHVGHWYDRDHIGLAVFYPNRVQQDWETGKYAPGFYWHAIDAGVPLSGQPNRFAYADPRLGLSYDLFGTGNTILRGGWGVYRFVTQVNTVANGEAAGTAASVLGYGTPGGTNIQLQNIGKLAYSACPNPLTGAPPPCGVQGGQTGLDASNFGQPMTQAYNLTIDQRLKWNTQIEVAYVGSQSSQLVQMSEDISASDFNELANVNKMPIGALFTPDPVTGMRSTNPENVGTNPMGLGTATPSGVPTGNNYADWHPYGYAYGTNSVVVQENTAWADYNGLQVSWIKSTGRLTFDFNGSWAKALGTTLQANPYKEGANYGPTAQDRPFVFNSTYTYNSGTLHMANRGLNILGSGWTISGISTWQAGGYVPAELGNGVPNFGLGTQYASGMPPDTNGASCYSSGSYVLANCSLAKDAGVTTGISQKSYFGTDESGLPIIPVLTCNPTKGLATHQILNGTCFNAPALSFNGLASSTGTVQAVSAQGGQAFPYMRTTPYFDNDLAIYRTINIHENQNVQLRLSAFDWLNHSLLTFSSGSYYTVNYNQNYSTRAITPNYTTGATGFGYMADRSALPYARVLELDLKYNF